MTKLENERQVSEILALGLAGTEPKNVPKAKAAQKLLTARVMRIIHEKPSRADNVLAGLVLRHAPTDVWMRVLRKNFRRPHQLAYAQKWVYSAWNAHQQFRQAVRETVFPSGPIPKLYKHVFLKNLDPMWIALDSAQVALEHIEGKIAQEPEKLTTLTAGQELERKRWLRVLKKSPQQAL
ncbi:MAG: hypothetical protein V1708_00635 [Candidatus Micrarchaeota archaeon]